MKKLVTFLTVVVLSATMTGIVSFAEPVQATSRETIVLNQKINEIGGSGKPYSIRDLPFTEGGTYQLIEFAPIGYAIYHPEAYLFVEYALDTPSPYQGITDNIFYAGPLHYLKQTGEKLVDIKTGSSFESLETLRLESNSVYNYQLSYRDSQAYDYIHGNINQYAVPMANSAPTYVPYDFYFRLLSSFGENTQGTCGYLACSILLGYYDSFNSSAFVNDSYITREFYYGNNYYTDGHSPAISNQLHLDLINIGNDLGIGNSTMPRDISRIMNTYLNGVNLASDCNQFLEYATTDLVLRLFINQGSPFIIEGNLQNPQVGGRINHAIVAYGYEIWSNVTYYITHYGWVGFQEVHIANLWGENLIGGTYCFEYTGPHIHNMNYYIRGRGVLCGCEL